MIALINLQFKESRSHNARLIRRRITPAVAKGLSRQAAVALLRPRQVGKTTLAGRIEYIELNALDCLEIEGGLDAQTRLWTRGGFPDSYMAADDANSLVYRRNFIRTYLERGAPKASKGFYQS